MTISWAMIVRVGRRTLVLLAAAGMVLIATIGAGLALTRTAVAEPVMAADVALLREVSQWRTPALDAASVIGTDLASISVVFGVGTLVAVTASVIARRWWPFVLMAVALLGENTLFVLAANAVGRTRPPVDRLDGVLPPTSSFPSGHTAAAICLYGGAAAILVVALRSRWRWVAVAVAVALVVIVAVSRIYRGAHHPSDLIGSVLLAVPWLLASTWAVRPATDSSTGDDAGTRRR